MSDRFRETRHNIYSFGDRILVQCPSCDSEAVVLPLNPDQSDLFAPRRFSCSACGRTQDWLDSEIVRYRDGEPMDYYFHYPLWLQIPCCSQILWVYNSSHLDLIEAFVQAKLRESRADETTGAWHNSSIYSRLPQWLQSRKHRSQILKAIERMRLTKNMRRDKGLKPTNN